MHTVTVKAYMHYMYISKSCVKQYLEALLCYACNDTGIC